MLSDLQPWLYPWARWLVSISPGLTITSVRRSYYEQVELWQASRRGEVRYPVAPPGYSLHERGRAWDMVGSSAALQRAGYWWERVGGRWGGRFGDPIHFEA